MNGEAPSPASPLSGGRLERLTAAPDPAVRRGTQLAGLTARQLRRGPGAPGGWSRFLLAHLRWILITTLLVVAAAGALVHAQTPLYKSQGAVDVWFASPDATALQPPNMTTEKGIVSSGVVLAIASRSLGVPQSQLLSGLSVSVPASSSLLQIAYSDPVPYVARARALAIAQAYVTYRTPKTAPPKQSTKTAASTPAFESLRAALITSPALPSSPSSPNFLVDIGAALIIGLGLAIGTAAIRDHLDDRFRSPAEIDAQTGAPLLALVPAFVRAERGPASLLTMTWSHNSVVAEAYRSVRTRVIAAAAARGARTLLITSPGWEKKSMIAANLAVALAQSGRRTVLVCADLRWGQAHEFFGVDNEDGLTTLLDRQTDLLSELRLTEIQGLWVLPPGPVPPDPAEVLQRPALRTVVGEIRSHADFVIIDGPPLLATSDTAPLAGIAEMILLVGDARMSTRANVRAAMREIDDIADKLIGSVLYNAGRRRWLRKSDLPAPVFDRPDLDTWSYRDVVDGHEAASSRPGTTNISMTTGPA
jgi:capsular exopolysaccharide synthesis family protein